jgi:hypothetical protein
VPPPLLLLPVLRPRFDILVDVMLLINALILVNISWAKLKDDECTVNVDKENPLDSDGKVGSSAAVSLFRYLYSLALVDLDRLSSLLLIPLAYICTFAVCSSM